MTNKHFIDFTEEQQADYQKYAEEHWDSNLVKQSYTLWNNLNTEGKKELLADGERITLAIVDAMPAAADSPEIQVLIAEWHAYINRFYDCNIEIPQAWEKCTRKTPNSRLFIAEFTRFSPNSSPKPSTYTAKSTWLITDRTGKNKDG